jgi:hypothetical protein
MSYLRGLFDVDAFDQHSPAELDRLGRDLLAEVFGPAWGVPAQQLQPGRLAFVHHRTGLNFVLVPGGSLTMGLIEGEAALIDLFLGRLAARPLADIRAASTPPCEVQVAPFLCGERLLTKADVMRLAPAFSPNPLGDLKRDAALDFAAQLGFRLPSDAELEWLARQGRQSPFVLDCALAAAEDDEENVIIVPKAEPVGRFGIHDLFRTQWAADDWFPNHQGRPPTSVARTGGDAQGVRRFEEFDYAAVGDEAVTYELSARRDAGAAWVAGVRLSLSLDLS